MPVGDEEVFEAASVEAPLGVEARSPAAVRSHLAAEPRARGGLFAGGFVGGFGLGGAHLEVVAAELGLQRRRARIEQRIS